MIAGIEYLAQNKYTALQLYALVTQYILVIATMTIGGYLLGRYVLVKTVICGGIIATVGAIFGIVFFIYQLLKIGKINE